MFEPLLSSLFSSLFSPLIAAAQRILITLNGVDEYFTFQNTKTFPDDFDLSIDAVLPTTATTVTLFGQTASADHYIKALSTGFVSINIDTSIVTSTVLATKDSKQRRYGVRVVGDDFIFTEEGVAIDTVTDAVAAAKTLIINVIAQSNGADFFNNTLSDPILTDLTTASNSVAWQLNRALPATTEQSTDGTNLLTYVGAPKTELFTFNQSDGGWDGSVDAIPQPIDVSDFTSTAGGTAIPPNQFDFTASGQGLFIDHGVIGQVRLNANINTTASNIELRDSPTGFIADLLIASGDPIDESDFIYTSVEGGAYVRNPISTTGTFTINSLSIKRFIQIA